MCTDATLKKHIREYATLKNQISELEKLAKAESEFILTEMETRNTKEFDGKTIVTERLNENATKEGKQVLKDLFPDTIDNLLNITLSVFINTAAAKKFL